MAIPAFFLPLGPGAHRLLHFLVAWDIFCLIFLLLHWITFVTTRPQHIRQEAQTQDEGRIIVFFIALIATTAGLMAVTLLLLDKNTQAISSRAFPLTVAFAGLLLSWVLVHTIFTVRYAHLYYADHKKERNTEAGGLSFPGEEKPGFLDFAYFSFVIGMTFQVSDVTITSGRLRRLVLFHSLLAFGFNTIIVALTVNVAAGLS